MNTNNSNSNNDNSNNIIDANTNDRNTPSPPTKSFPTKSPRVEVSGRPPINSYEHENSHPLELRVCSSQTLRYRNS